MMNITYNCVYNYSAMTERIEKLEAEVTELKRKLNRLLDSYCNTSESALKQLDALNQFDTERRADIEDIYQRLVPIEHHLFPGIKNDIRRVHQITKTDTPPIYNPLDIRRLKKP